MNKIKLVFLYLLTSFISFACGLYLGANHEKEQALDNLFSVCYSGAIIVKDSKVVGCWPMSEVGKEEQKELDNFKEPWYNRSILSKF